MGFFGSLTAEKYDRQYSDRVLVRRIAGYFIPQRGRLAIIAVLILLMSGLGALNPVVVSRGVDVIKTNQFPGGIYLICAAVLAIGVFSWLANYVRRRLTVRAIADTLVKLSISVCRVARSVFL
jgi:ATP-binding cassette subfamily B protein